MVQNPRVQRYIGLIEEGTFSDKEVGTLIGEQILDEAYEIDDFFKMRDWVFNELIQFMVEKDTRFLARHVFVTVTDGIDLFHECSFLEWDKRNKN